MSASQIRQMTAADWPAVSRIYQQGIDSGIATFETRVPDWDYWDKHHLDFGRLVVVDGKQILGWAALTPVSYRPVYRGVAEESVYVANEAQGKGVGTRLLQTLINAAEAEGIWTLQGTIFRVNTGSIALHEKCGFRIVGYRERIAQRAGIWHDTVIMERRSANVGL